MDFSNIDKMAENLSQEQKELNGNIKQIHQEQTECSEHLDEMLHEINKLAEQLGEKQFEFNEVKIEDLNTYVNQFFPNDGSKVSSDKQHEMQDIDYLISALSGGLAAIVDAFLVKIPKSTTIIKGGNKIFQEGSPLTETLRNIGFDNNGKTSQWVTTLEKWFKVPYDKSIDPEILGLTPKSHRLHSLAHDPSICGLFWGIKDIVTGTFTCIDKNGCLVIEKVAEASFTKLFMAPILWFGHLLSDVFTRMGIPIPGWCYLQLLQFGSFGEKQRTIAEITRYMYLEGFDLRHFVSMSATNAVIEIIIRLYYHLVCRRRTEEFSLNAEKEYIEIKNERKLHNMLFTSYAVASCGNITKICAYGGNPLAFNLPLWLGMIKEAIVQVKVSTSSSKDCEKAIENRHVIDENFDFLRSIIIDKKN